ncbi:hypothetical protein BDV59DRAFT_205796 [Aspergillus ambiguus]|uniref:uncharacterized protein n=1 Tax=Aspergillus ambiguus TaxID=176160 RepID=UPI003CCD7BE8
MASDGVLPVATPEPQSQSSPPVATTLRLYKRLANGRKALFAPSDSAPARYFVNNPIPHRHHTQWTPVFYRGDNPKYAPESTVIGRAFRNALWETLEVQLGEGVGEALENERRRKEAKKLRAKNRMRKIFGAGAKDPVEDLSEREIVGRITVIRVKRASVFKRRVEWELDGVVYQWTGTRRFSTSFMKGVKGWSHSLKLVRKSDHALAATFEKSRWASFSGSIRSGGPPNKSKQFVGSLHTYALPAASGNALVPVPEIRVEPDIVQDIHRGFTREDELNDAIALTCWMAVEAEHRLRWKVVDVLQHLGEAAGEGGG